MREVISGTGSRFLLCEYAKADVAYAKYPPQPVHRCSAFETEVDDAAEEPSAPGDI